MADEEVVVDQGQEADQEPIEEVVEGFDGDEPAEETPVKKEAEPKKPEESESPLKGEVESMKRQIHDLNRALHEARSKKTEEGEQLTDEQLKVLLKEHKDDPETLYNLINYIGSQAAKKTSQETVDAQRVSALKTKSEELIYSKFPVLKDQGSPYYQQAEKVKSDFNLKDHPAGAYLSAAVIVMNEIDQVKKAEYERGKKDGLKGLSEEKRKQVVKDTTLTPTSLPSGKGSEGLSGSMKDTAKQMDLTPGQQKIYARLIAKRGA